MSNLAAPTIAELHAWREQQNPLVRALTEPLVERVSVALTDLQAVNDRQAVAIDQMLATIEAYQGTAEGWRVEVETLGNEVETLRNEAAARKAEAEGARPTMRWPCRSPRIASTNSSGSCSARSRSAARRRPTPSRRRRSGAERS